MRLTARLWRIRAQIAAMIVAEAVQQGGFLFLLLYALPWVLAYMWYFDALSRTAMAVFLAIIAVAFGCKIASGVDDAPLPRRDYFTIDSREEPKLHTLIGEVAADMKVEPPATVLAMLGPLARGPGEPLGRAATLPVACLGIWSLADLRCHIADGLSRRPPPFWLFLHANAAATRLAQLQFQMVGPKKSDLDAKIVRRIATTLRRGMAEWQILTDIQTDAAVARVYGAATVAAWIERTALAEFAVTVCLSQSVIPAAQRGRLLPIADTCGALCGALEPGWSAVFGRELQNIGRTRPRPPVGTAAIRIAALGGGTGSAYDPRPASSAFEAWPASRNASRRRRSSRSRRSSFRWPSSRSHKTSYCRRSSHMSLATRHCRRARAFETSRTW